MTVGSAAMRRWVLYALVAVIFAVACILLSVWQFNRRAEAVDAMAVVQANYDASPRPLAEVLPGTDTFQMKDEWLPVIARGTYLEDQQVLARNRPYKGQPGFEILTPFLLDTGNIFIVDRGWIPTGNKQDYPDEVPAAPSGEITVVARLQENEPKIVGQTNISGQMGTIHLEDFNKALGGKVYTGAYGLLESEVPSGATTGVLAERPTLTEGNHLSYAFQWIAFAVLGFVALVWGIRTEISSRANQANGLTPQRRASARRVDLDSEAEDAVDDALRGHQIS